MSTSADSENDSAAVRLDLVRRLRLAEGQLRGIQRMVAENRDCEEICTQLLAVRSAVDRMLGMEIGCGVQDSLAALAPDAAAARVSRLVGMMSKAGRPEGA